MDLDCQRADGNREKCRYRVRDASIRACSNATTMAMDHVVTPRNDESRALAGIAEDYGLFTLAADDARELGRRCQSMPHVWRKPPTVLCAWIRLGRPVNAAIVPCCSP